MRIVVDMQGAQSSGSRSRGIGRYTTAIIKALVRQRHKHDIVLALNGLFAETIEPLRGGFNDLLPQTNIVVWQASGPLAHIDQGNNSRRYAAEITYEAFLANLEPDFIYVTSLFEGLSDDAITSVHRLQKHVPVAVTLYDLIPFINPDPYLLNPVVKTWYLEKIEHLKRADLWLAISESARQEGISHLGFSPEQSINVSTDADEQFRSLSISDVRVLELQERYGLSKSFIMYTGGIDHRKNVEGLVRAYSMLPKGIRNQHQLAIVCSVQPSSSEMLKQLARQHGLADGELVLTGFVPEADLVDLYNLCHLFVFPSWHEGFGLPALEAMRCGAAVIGANTSSLPEVIGWESALFDPYSDDAIAKLMLRALSDESFRQTLIKSGNEQAKLFSWDESARRVIAAMEGWHGRKSISSISASMARPKLAYVSPLPSARSGIADYSAELLPELARYYDIDVIVDQEESLSDAWISANCTTRSGSWLAEHANQYERVLYHFGNSHFHQYMFDLLDQIPGVVVLHDFFLSGIQAYRDVHQQTPHAWSRALLASHGYNAVQERFTAHDTTEVIWRYPTNLPVLQRALGIIVHSQNSKDLALSWYGKNAAINWAVIPLLRTTAPIMDRAAIRRELGFGDDDLLVCSFGILGPSKLNHRLVQAWLSSSLANNPNAHLVFVGQNDGGLYGYSLLKNIESCTGGKRIKITGWADIDTFQRYLTAADIGIQLRGMSRGETSAAVLDCMNYGLPTIVNANGSMADLDPTGVYLLPDHFDEKELSDALMTLALDSELRSALGQRAREIVKNLHSPDICAESYFQTIEQIYSRAEERLPGLLHELAELPLQKSELLSLSNDLARNFPPIPRLRQLLIDVSGLVQCDVKTGVQVGVRAILKEWLLNPPSGFKIEPVYATIEHKGYRYAREFTCRFLDIPSDWVFDDPVECWEGDFFIGLDLQPTVTIAQQANLSELYNRGIKVYFVVYDLLPLLLPKFFDFHDVSLHRNWLETISKFDGVLCISKAVASEVSNWQSAPARLKPFDIKYFHLGADLNSSVPTRGIPNEGKGILDLMRRRYTFLMVGTIEPRKGHRQVLDAFDLLWSMGMNVNLVIVGEQGKQVEVLFDNIHEHYEIGKRLHWLEDISDEFLEQIYSVSSCLVAASYGEGFGLPLIEAAQHKLPIFARDIPVFREVADEHAYYFSAGSATELADEIQNWLVLYEQGNAPSSEKMPWLTWQQSAQQLLKCVLID